MLRRFIRTARDWKRKWSGIEPVIRLEVSRSALLDNLATLKTLAPQWSVAPVLKANAYGHGLAQVAEVFETAPGVPFFAVDSYFEAEYLRSSGIEKPLLILGFTRSRTIVWNTLRNVSFVIASLEQLNELHALGVTQKVQIKFDTGMHRQGIAWTAVSAVTEKIRKTSLQVEGVLSHFAESETSGSPLTTKQIGRWNELAKKFQREFPSIQYYHIANSGGFGHAKDIVANCGRSGIALYGINPGNLRVLLRPACRMVSVVSAIQTVEIGETVGYNATFTTSKKMKLATVPVGYFEGVDRRLSNKGAYMLNGARVPILGRVSMNISSCDISDIENVSFGTEVEIIANRPQDPNSVEHMARLCETIPYEILVHIPAHLRRVIVL